MSSYNKFVKSNVSKLGFEIARSGGLTPTMATGAMTAIPIWELLSITEEQYLTDYEYPAFVKNQARLDAELKAIVDASGLAPFVSEQDAIDALNAEPTDASSNDVLGDGAKE